MPEPLAIPPRVTAFDWAVDRISRVSRVVRPRGARAWAIVVVALLAIMARPIDRHLRAASLLLRLAGEQTGLAAAFRSELAVESVEIPMEVTAAKGTPGTVRARIYRPLGVLSLEAPRGIVLAHGVHHLGIDEPRLVALARTFAQSGLVVLTPELAPLADYRVDDEGNLDTLRVSVRHLAHRRDLVRGGGVGLVGVSFAGGLSMRVASEPALRSDLAFVTSIGGHHDMRRVARFFVTDKVATPSGEVAWKAHDYGLAVLVYNAPQRFVPTEDAEPLRVAVRAFLHESYPAAEQASLLLSPSARVVFDRIYHRDRLALAKPVLTQLPAMEPTMYGASPVDRVKAIGVPIFLLHGAHDDVVPPSEARWIAAEARSDQEVHLLVTTKIGHAELGEADSMETVRLVRFMADLLSG